MLPELGVSEVRSDVDDSEVEDPVRAQEGLGNAHSEDAESLAFDDDEGSEVSGDEQLVPPTEPDPMVVESRGVTPMIRAALVELGTVDLVVDFSQRAAVMKTALHFCRGPVRSAMSLALGESL